MYCPDKRFIHRLLTACTAPAALSSAGCDLFNGPKSQRQSPITEKVIVPVSRTPLSALFIIADEASFTDWIWPDFILRLSLVLSPAAFILVQNTEMFVMEI